MASDGQYATLTIAGTDGMLRAWQLKVDRTKPDATISAADVAAYLEPVWPALSTDALERVIGVFGGDFSKQPLHGESFSYRSSGALIGLGDVRLVPNRSLLAYHPGDRLINEDLGHLAGLQAASAVETIDPAKVHAALANYGLSCREFVRAGYTVTRGGPLVFDSYDRALMGINCRIITPNDTDLVELFSALSAALATSESAGLRALSEDVATALTTGRDRIATYGDIAAFVHPVDSEGHFALIARY